MRIVDCFHNPRPVFSFEFFPPKTEEATNRLFATVEHLAELQPSFVSVTYGAGGSTRKQTVALTERIKRELGIEAMAHLTCVGHTSQELDAILQDLKASGIENVLALRGDPPRGQTEFIKTEGGFGYGSELIRFIRQNHDFCIGGACYPEGHPENPDPDADLRYLVQKVKQGVDFLVTQLFLDNAAYFQFVRRAREAGITCPILPGIMPVTNVAQIERFTSICGASIPAELFAKLDRVREDEQAVMATGIEWALRQCRELLASGAPGIHFYTLNKSLATRLVYISLLGL